MDRGGDDKQQGARRSRDGVLLEHCVADCRAWLGLDPDRDANGTTQFLLEIPSVDDIRAAISEAGNYVLAQRDKPQWNGGGLPEDEV